MTIISQAEVALQKLKDKALPWALALYIMNLVDMSFTIFYLTRGFEEANPAMNALWLYHPSAFIVAKVFGIAFLVLLILNFMNRHYHLWFLRGLTIVYAALCVYHLWGFHFFFM